MFITLHRLFFDTLGASVIPGEPLALIVTRIQQVEPDLTAQEDGSYHHGARLHVTGMALPLHVVESFDEVLRRIEEALHADR